MGKQQLHEKKTLQKEMQQSYLYTWNWIYLETKNKVWYTQLDNNGLLYYRCTTPK